MVGEELIDKLDKVKQDYANCKGSDQIPEKFLKNSYGALDIKEDFKDYMIALEQNPETSLGLVVINLFEVFNHAENSRDIVLSTKEIIQSKYDTPIYKIESSDKSIKLGFITLGENKKNLIRSVDEICKEIHAKEIKSKAGIVCKSVGELGEYNSDYVFNKARMISRKTDDDKITSYKIV